MWRYYHAEFLPGCFQWQSGLLYYYYNLFPVRRVEALRAKTPGISDNCCFNQENILISDIAKYHQLVFIKSQWLATHENEPVNTLRSHTTISAMEIVEAGSNHQHFFRRMTPREPETNFPFKTAIRTERREEPGKAGPHTFDLTNAC